MSEELNLSDKINITWTAESVTNVDIGLGMIYAILFNIVLPIIIVIILVLIYFLIKKMVIRRKEVLALLEDEK